MRTASIRSSASCCRWWTVSWRACRGRKGYRKLSHLRILKRAHWRRTTRRPRAIDNYHISSALYIYFNKRLAGIEEQFNGASWFFSKWNLSTASESAIGFRFLEACFIDWSHASGSRNEGPDTCTLVSCSCTGVISSCAPVLKSDEAVVANLKLALYVTQVAFRFPELPWQSQTGQHWTRCYLRRGERHSR